MTLQQQFGHIDIYLFDQLLRGRIRPGQRVLDVGCGGGRNLVYLLREGFEVYGTDIDPAAVAGVQALAADLAPGTPADRFRVEPLEQPSFAVASMDVVLCNTVLHFARGHAHFDQMVDSLWRLVAPGGLLFARLASSIGMADRMQPLGEGRYHLPDGSDRYLVDEARLAATTRRLGGTLLDPLKTTVVQDQRCMTTWVIGKPHSPSVG
ncbi:MAG: class I SAM-dependent methyltransferase [Vicinamibacterales bacterium]